ncbi:hypothetical protein BDZ85DRAFT_68588 [Elsinoe ampelina]|uniref:Uncharacterized protein n=1 Tax=Elsinoe ampelina TaxID=302913 RepID=A0A6A6GIW8_9PEZI|nr:hypothetical protein BDZ85DRAFT_68588 [Elsinoe ampelina]
MLQGRRVHREKQGADGLQYPVVCTRHGRNFLLTHLYFTMNHLRNVSNPVAIVSRATVHVHSAFSQFGYKYPKRSGNSALPQHDHHGYSSTRTSNLIHTRPIPLLFRFAKNKLQLLPNIYPLRFFLPRRLYGTILDFFLSLHARKGWISFFEPTKVGQTGCIGRDTLRIFEADFMVVRCRDEVNTHGREHSMARKWDLPRR